MKYDISTQLILEALKPPNHIGGFLLRLTAVNKSLFLFLFIYINSCNILSHFLLL